MNKFSRVMKKHIRATLIIGIASAMLLAFCAFSFPAITERASVKMKIEQYNQQEMVVYITRTGKKYHCSGCGYLSKSKIPISLKDAKKNRYTPCKACNPPL